MVLVATTQQEKSKGKKNLRWKEKKMKKGKQQENYNTYHEALPEKWIERRS